VTLAICGLGMLDETEVADIPEVQATRATSRAPRERVPEPPQPPADLPPPMSAYATVAAPPPPALDPPAPEPEPPDGYVRIQRIDSAPTKNENVTKHSITFSTGEVVTTINQWLATVAVDYCEKRTPVKPDTRITKWGIELVALQPADAPPTLPLEPMPLDSDIPF